MCLFIETDGTISWIYSTGHRFNHTRHCKPAATLGYTSRKLGLTSKPGGGILFIDEIGATDVAGVAAEKSLAHKWNHCLTVRAMTKMTE